MLDTGIPAKEKGMNALHDGDIVVIESNWFRHFFTSYDHAALLWSRDKEWYTIEAVPTGVRSYLLGHWGRPYIILRPRDSTEQGWQAANIALSWLGEPYSFWTLLELAWQIIVAKFFRKPIPVRVAVVKRVCSQLVHDAWLKAGIDITPGVDKPTPEQIALSDVLEIR